MIHDVTAVTAAPCLLSSNSVTIEVAEAGVESVISRDSLKLLTSLNSSALPDSRPSSRCSFCSLEGVPPTTVQLFKPLSLGRWPLAGHLVAAHGRTWPQQCANTPQTMATYGNYVPFVTANHSLPIRSSKSQNDRRPKYHSCKVLCELLSSETFLNKAESCGRAELCSLNSTPEVLWWSR